MSRMTPRVLVVGEAGGDDLVADLTRIGCIAARVDDCERAIGSSTGGIDAVVISVINVADWLACSRLAARVECPVVVVTPLLAADRRYREFAFGTRVAAYVCPPYTDSQLRETLQRVIHGERGVELVESAPFREL